MVIVNEVIEYQELLNSISSTNAWQYYPLENVIQSLKKDSDLPVSLIGFESKHGAGVDPYYGLPYQRHLYYINTENPRNSLNDFFAGAARNLEPKLKKKLGAAFSFSDYLPAMTFSKSITIAKAVPTPIVESAELSLSFSATLTALNSKISDFVELEKEFKGDFSMKVKSAYDHVFSNFKMVLGPSANGFPMDMGVKNDILVGDNSGTFTSKVSIAPDTSYSSMMETASTRGMVQRYKAKSSGEYTGSCKFSFGGTEWQIDFTIGYEVDAKLRLNGMDYSEPFEYSAVEISLTENSTADSRLWNMDDLRDSTGNWYDKNKGTINTVAGVALIVSAVGLTAASFGIASPESGAMVLMGFRLLTR